ncbi:MAG: hypothetical protein IT440_13010 [Phycisphaeraceae bacterium]|nr:hypothetical protein [Phycisphaeraceae bacterium]
MLLPALLILLLTTQAATDAESQLLPDIIADLKQEAKQGWEQRRQWPRLLPDYAQDKKLTLESDQVIAALASATDEDAVADAWIKWQLLSFKPDFAKAALPQLGQVVSRMPMVLKQPQPDVKRAQAGPPRSAPTLYDFNYKQAVKSDLPPLAGTNTPRPVTESISRGTTSGDGPGVTFSLKPDAGVAETVQLENRLLELRRTLIQRVNMPALAYRDLLTESLPPEGGVRLAAMLQDVLDRIAAGDPSANDVVRKLVAQAVSQTEDSTLTPAIRRDLSTQTARVQQMYTNVAQSLSLDKRGKLQIDTITVRMDTQAYKSILAALRGQRLREKN